MTSLLALRSVPLSHGTRNAWHNAGVRFRRRGVTKAWSSQYRDNAFAAVLNLGSLSHSFDHVPVPIFNEPETIRSISHPKALRRTLDNFLPPSVDTSHHWHKCGGFGGRGTTFHESRQDDCDDFHGDTQLHVSGMEYRILSVGERIVQASLKHGSHSQFDWEWVGVEGVKKNGIIPLLKEAIQLIPGADYSVFGWDIIHDGSQPYILECNTSPGVNEATAQRIVQAIKEKIS